jgi:hypothetical protein
MSETVQSEVEDDDDEGMCYLHNYTDHQFLDGRHRLIGDLHAKWNVIKWSPAGSGMWYFMTAEKFSDFMLKHCCDENSQCINDDTFREYASLLPERALKVKDMILEHRARLERLNQQLMQIEKDIIKEALPQLESLQARVDDPDDWLQDYYCECKLCFSLRQDDPDYDEENSENVIIKRSHGFSMIKEMYDHQINEGINWNEFEGWEGHLMRDEVHCWLYHDLYDHTDIGWANIVRIGEVWINIEYTSGFGNISLVKGA